MRAWKKYRLDNGDQITAKELAEKINITVNCARVRLCNYTDPARIYNPTQQARQSDKSAKTINPNPRYLQNKMLYEQSEAGKLMRLALKTIWIS